MNQIAKKNSQQMSRKLVLDLLAFEELITGLENSGFDSLEELKLKNFRGILPDNLFIKLKSYFIANKF